MPLMEKGGSDRPSSIWRVRVRMPLSPKRKRKAITPTRGGNNTGSEARAAKIRRPGKSKRWKTKASGMPMRADSTTLPSEMSRLLPRASIWEALRKNSA